MALEAKARSISGAQGKFVYWRPGAWRPAAIAAGSISQVHERGAEWQRRLGEQIYDGGLPERIRVNWTEMLSPMPPA
jgi:hypothetical protein